MTKPKTISRQGKAFIAKAKELGIETSEAAFNAVLRRIGKTSVQAKPEKKAKKSS